MGSVYGYRLELRKDTTSSQLYIAGRIGTGTINGDIVVEAPINSNTWHHAVLVGGNGALKLFVDGVEVASSPWSGNLVKCTSCSNDAFTIGGYSGQSFGGTAVGSFAGEIDEQVLYLRRILNSEIKAHSLLTDTHVIGNYIWQADISDGKGFARAGPNSFTITDSSTQNPPDAPSNLVATTKSQTEISLTWNDNSNNEERFEIERRTPPSTGTFSSIVSNLAPNSGSYLDNTGLLADTSYEYRVKAVNGAGSSGWSNLASSKTLKNDAFTFNLSVNPSSQTIIWGQTASMKVNITRLTGTSLSVNLTLNISSPYSGAINISGNNCNPQPECIVTINFSALGVTPKQYSFDIAGKYIGMVQSPVNVQYLLTVQSCGNNVCDSGETCSSCSADCGSCPPGGGSGSGSGSGGSGRGSGTGVPNIVPQCDDGKDNDNDGFIDYPLDPGCITVNDDNEFDLGRSINDSERDPGDIDGKTDKAGDNTTISIILWSVVILLVSAISLVTVIIIRMLREHKKFKKLSDVVN